jgi:hypothetical protein
VREAQAHPALFAAESPPWSAPAGKRGNWCVKKNATSVLLAPVGGAYECAKASGGRAEGERTAMSREHPARCVTLATHASCVILRPHDPVEVRVRDAVRSEEEAQLGGMLLGVAHSVEQQFQRTDRPPLPLFPRELVGSTRPFAGQRLDGVLALLREVGEIGAQVFFGVGLLGAVHRLRRVLAQQKAREA